VTAAITRRELFSHGASAAAVGALFGRAALIPSPAAAQAPKRGGTLSLRLWDPPHWDPYLTLAFRTQVPYTLTHSRLLKLVRSDGKPGQTVDGESLHPLRHLECDGAMRPRPANPIRNGRLHRAQFGCTGAIYSCSQHARKGLANGGVHVGAGLSPPGAAST